MSTGIKFQLCTYCFWFNPFHRQIPSSSSKVCHPIHCCLHWSWGHSPQHGQHLVFLASSWHKKLKGAKKFGWTCSRCNGSPSSMMNTDLHSSKLTWIIFPLPIPFNYWVWESKPDVPIIICCKPEREKWKGCFIQATEFAQNYAGDKMFLFCRTYTGKLLTKSSSCWSDMVTR